ncbi:MAG: hypothetical protein ACREQY_24740 [Candidatus Binatia bacterium]
MRKRPIGIFAGFLGAVLLASAGTATAASELEEIRDTQKKILERLDAQDKILRDIQSRMQAGAAARAGQPDPDTVYDIPVASSAVKGPKNARVVMVEFSDFQ